MTLWTTSAATASTTFQVVLPVNLDELVARVASELADHLDERVRPYRTKVTIETLWTPVA